MYFEILICEFHHNPLLNCKEAGNCTRRVEVGNEPTVWSATSIKDEMQAQPRGLWGVAGAAWL